MDRRVKERLIGASILVALFVLVVPELLSGPKPAASRPPMLPAATAPEPIRNVMVDLSTSKPPADAEQEPGGQAASAAVPDAAPANAAATPTASPQNSAPQNSAPQNSAPQNTAPPNSAPQAAGSPAAKPVAARTAAVESSAPSPISTGHGWSVQLGSFASRANADNLTRQMKGQGFSAFVLPGGSGSSLRYRVRVGPLTDRESAERMAAKLKSLGHVSSLVGPAG
jgi:DedD protein